MTAVTRDYKIMAGAIRPGLPWDLAMQAVVDVLWEHLHNAGVSWVGFYIDRPTEPSDRRLILGPCRDKPACSPIGLHGVCGQGLCKKEVQIVRDVRDLGENYIACDPRDRSEIVVPLLESDGTCWGVLDVDSWEAAAFSDEDAKGLLELLQRAQLTI